MASTAADSWKWRALALAVLTLLSSVAVYQASLVVDGTRYFWLDDDQMISMRYARNLVEGHGLVWNPGERVEGYTNFLWTLVMAAVHVLPLGDAHAAVAVQAINWVLGGAVLLLSERLLRVLHPHPGLALPALLLMLAVNLDLVYWSVHGFETTLLTAAFLAVVVRLLQESTRGPRLGTYLLMGALPLIRSDAYHLWAAAAVLALGVSGNRRRTTALLAVSLLPPLAHLLCRHAYYGEWLPNTYYLKVAGVPGRTALGADYLARFLGNYGVALALGLAGVWRARDRRRWLLVAGGAITGGYVLHIGADLFGHSRFLAHLVPVTLVLGAIGCIELSRQRVVQAMLLVAFAAVTVFMAGVYDSSLLADENGEPESGLVAGLLIQRFTRPEATVAALAAGNVSYFSRRRVIDMLGKSDAHIARLPVHPGGFVGHNKFDPEYSLGLGPDLVVSSWVHKWVIDAWTIEQARKGGDEFITAVVSSPPFQRDYRPNPVNVPYLLEHNAVYVRNSSPELARRGSWQQPRIGRP